MQAKLFIVDIQLLQNALQHTIYKMNVALFFQQLAIYMYIAHGLSQIHTLMHAQIHTYAHTLIMQWHTTRTRSGLASLHKEGLACPELRSCDYLFLFHDIRLKF